MRTRYNEALASFRRSQKVAVRYLSDVAGDETSARSVLDDVVAKMEQLVTDERAALEAARAETRRQDVLATVIRRNHLHPLVAVMRSRGMHEGIPKCASKYMKRRELVLVCRTVIARAEQVKERLVRAGLPPGFLAEMVRSVQALDASLQARASHLGIARAAVAGLLMHIRRGRHALNGLEALLSIRYAMEPQVLLEWRHARRMGYRRAAPEDVSQESGGDAA